MTGGIHSRRRRKPVNQQKGVTPASSGVFLLWPTLYCGGNHCRMWLKSIHLINIGSFANSGAIEFSPTINLLIGPNNAGKSIITRAIAALQPLPNHPQQGLIDQFFRRGAGSCELTLELGDPNSQQLKIPNGWDLHNWHPKVVLARDPKTGPHLSIIAPNGQPHALHEPVCNQQQPNNFIFPYFSRRKPAALHEGVNLANAQTPQQPNLRPAPSLDCRV